MLFINSPHTIHILDLGEYRVFGIHNHASKIILLCRRATGVICCGIGDLPLKVRYGFRNRNLVIIGAVCIRCKALYGHGNCLILTDLVSDGSDVGMLILCSERNLCRCVIEAEGNDFQHSVCQCSGVFQIKSGRIDLVNLYLFSFKDSRNITGCLFFNGKARLSDTVLLICQLIAVVKGIRVSILIAKSITLFCLNSKRQLIPLAFPFILIGIYILICRVIIDRIGNTQITFLNRDFIVFGNLVFALKNLAGSIEQIFIIADFLIFTKEAHFFRVSRVFYQTGNGVAVLICFIIIALCRVILCGIGSIYILNA